MTCTHPWPICMSTGPDLFSMFVDPEDLERYHDALVEAGKLPSETQH